MTFEAEEWLDTSLAACANLKVLADVAVVDNNSSDRTVKLLKEKFGTVVDYFYPLSENKGFGYAHNIVFSDPTLPEFDFYFLLNQDATISVLNLRALLNAATIEKNFGVLSPIHFYNEEEIDGKFKNYLEEAGYANSKKAILKVSFVNAAIWLLRAEVVKKIGHFHFAFPHYGEDKNYLHRVVAAGYEVGVVSKAIAFHYRKQAKPGRAVFFKPYELWVFAQALLLNPSGPLLNAITGIIHQYSKAMWRAVFTGQSRDFIDHFKYFLKILSLLTEIRNARSIYIYDRRLKGYNYISLNNDLT